MSKRILITGSAGFVGSHLVDHIERNTDWDIIGIDSFNHRGDSCRVYQDCSRYKIYTHDLSTPISQILINKIGHVDYIINMASESHVDRSIKDPIPFVTNNVQLVLNVLDYARKVKPEKFIQISTDEVFGDAYNDTHSEWDKYYPSNPYSASKAAQDMICYSYWRTYQMPIIITHTMNMIGERQDKEKFLPKLISKIYKDEQVEIHGNKDNIGTRYYLHARNCADALLFILNSNEPTIYYDSNERVLPDKFNITSEDEVSNLELAQMVANILGKELNYKFTESFKVRPGYDHGYALDGTKLKDLGWKPPVPFENCVKNIVRWTLNNQEWL